MVCDSIASPLSGLLREARLGLLIQLLRDRHAEAVDTTLYDEECARRRERGEVWPASTSIARAFGDWYRAQMAAVHLAFLGTGARQPRSLHPWVSTSVHQSRGGRCVDRAAQGVWGVADQW